ENVNNLLQQNNQDEASLTNLKNNFTFSQIIIAFTSIMSMFFSIIFISIKRSLRVYKNSFKDKLFRIFSMHHCERNNKNDYFTKTVSSSRKRSKKISQRRKLINTTNCRSATPWPDKDPQDDQQKNNISHEPVQGVSPTSPTFVSPSPSPLDNSPT